MKVVKKVADIVIGIVIALILVVSVFFIVANATRGEKDVPQLFGLTFASVQTDSMTGTFEVGDIVVAKVVDENSEINTDDIISYFEVVNGQRIIKTHRVVRIETVGSTVWYYTQGDKAGLPEDPQPKSRDQLVAVYQFHIGGLGGFIDFLREPLGFILIIVLPILIVIAWEIYKLIVLYVEHKKAQILEESNSAKAESMEEMKAKIIQDYLDSLKKR